MGTPAYDVESDPFAWKQQAACQGLDPNMFHSSSKEDHELCKAICEECPVVRECLEYQLPFDRFYSYDKQLGIYGGLTVEERRLFWDRLRRANQPSRNWRLRKQRERERNGEV